MFCIECGHDLPDHAKFCSECGTKVEAAAGLPTQPPDATPLTPSPDDTARRQAIIDAADVEAMKELARAAVRDGDATDADFWYLEWITASRITQSEVIAGIHEYTEKLLIPESRFSEAELYVTWITRVGDPAQRQIASDTLQKMHQVRGSRGLKRNRCGNEWTKIDVTLPIDPTWTSDRQHQRAIAWLEAKSQNSDMDPIVNPDDPQCLPYLTGMVIGMRDSLTKIGADFEAAIQGLTDWTTYRVEEAERVASREREAEMRASRPKPPLTPKQATPAPTRNSLGEHIDSLFKDRKFGEQIKQALRCTSGLNDDVVVAAIPVSGKLGDGEDLNHQMIFTYDKAAIVKKSGIFSVGDVESFTNNQIEYVGIGDSDHYEGQGFGGRTTNWVSLTISLKKVSLTRATISLDAMKRRSTRTLHSYAIHSSG